MIDIVDIVWDLILDARVFAQFEKRCAELCGSNCDVSPQRANIIGAASGRKSPKKMWSFQMSWNLCNPYKAWNASFLCNKNHGLEVNRDALGSPYEKE